MRQSLRQLFISVIFSALGAFVLLLLLPSFGLDPNAGSSSETGLVIGLVILVVLYAQNTLSVVVVGFTNRIRLHGGPREEGTVKWFNSTKGFGFITGEDGDDVFVHYRSIRGRNRYLLRDGMTVSYVLGQSGKGPQAEDVDLTD